MAKAKEPTVISRADARSLERAPERAQVNPPVDIYETDSGLTLLADMPGVEASGLDVRVEEGLLTIQGRPERRLPDKAIARYSETSDLDYVRSFRLGLEIDAARVEATLTNGVLELKLPKSERARTRRIQVKTS